MLIASSSSGPDLAHPRRAYYLYSVCERRGWTQTALLFNGLGTSWLDLEAAARKAPAATGTQAAWDFDAAQVEQD